MTGTVTLTSPIEAFLEGIDLTGPMTSRSVTKLHFFPAFGLHGVHASEGAKRRQCQPVPLRTPSTTGHNIAPTDCRPTPRITAAGWCPQR